MRALAVVVALGGCAPDVDLTGDYAVRSDAFEAPCGSPQALTQTVRLELRSRPEGGYTFLRCGDEEGTLCLDDQFNWFSDPIDGGCRGRFGVSGNISPTGGCMLGFLEQTATLEDGHLVVEITSYRDGVELPAAQCTDDEALRRGTSLQCSAHETLEATQL